MVLTAWSKSQEMDLILNFLAGFNIFAVGTDSTAPTENDTSLGNEVFRDTIDSVTKGTNSVIYKCYIDKTEANGYALCEFGIFDSNGNMLLRETFGTINKTSDMSIWITVEIVVTIQ